MVSPPPRSGARPRANGGGFKSRRLQHKCYDSTRFFGSQGAAFVGPLLAPPINGLDLIELGGPDSGSQRTSVKREVSKHGARGDRGLQGIFGGSFLVKTVRNVPWDPLLVKLRHYSGKSDLTNNNSYVCSINGFVFSFFFKVILVYTVS